MLIPPVFFRSVIAMRRKIYIIGILCGILLLTGCEKGKNISNKAEQITSNVIKKA